jgi:hypothetical protein
MLFYYLYKFLHSWPENGLAKLQHVVRNKRTILNDMYDSYRLVETYIILIGVAGVPVTPTAVQVADNAVGRHLENVVQGHFHRVNKKSDGI